MQLTRQQYIMLQNLITIQLWESKKKQNYLENKNEMELEEMRLAYLHKKLELKIKELNKEIHYKFNNIIRIVEKKNKLNQNYAQTKIIKLKK